MPEILIEGPISQTMVPMVRAGLEEAAGGPVDVRISSEGGDIPVLREGGVTDLVVLVVGLCRCHLAALGKGDRHITI